MSNNRSGYMEISPYREMDAMIREIESLTKENKRLHALIDKYKEPTGRIVDFGAPCPACGSANRSLLSFGYFKVKRRILVPSRRYWWQFWRPIIGYFRVECDECTASFKERTRVLVFGTSTEKPRYE